MMLTAMVALAVVVVVVVAMGVGVTGLPKTVRVTSEETRDALKGQR